MVYILVVRKPEVEMGIFGRMRAPTPEEFPEWSRRRLEHIRSDMQVINLLLDEGSVKWPFKDMDVGDEVSFYPVSKRATRSAHSYGSARGWKFKTFQEWPLTIVQRIA